MSAKIRSIGIVRLQPRALDHLGGHCDDSTLDLFLAGLASRHSLADVAIPRRHSARFTLRRQLSWPASSDVVVSLRANMAQLIDELELEFERTERAGL